MDFTGKTKHTPTPLLKVGGQVPSGSAMELIPPPPPPPPPLTMFVASNVCLVGVNPTCSVPALQRCDGLL